MQVVQLENVTDICKFYLPKRLLPCALSTTDKMIYAYFCTYMHFTGSRIRNKNLAYKLGLSISSIYRSLNRLKRNNLIRIEGSTSKRRIFLSR